MSGKGRFDLYMCPFEDGKYGAAANLETLNTEFNEWDPFIAPDGSYLLFCSMKPGGLGGDDIYIAFKGKDGQWGPPKNLGAEVNSPGSENRPYVTHDGKYLFFTSTRNGNRDTFWVRAGFLDRFRS
jgi:Tol biopolymer transport system component